MSAVYESLKGMVQDSLQRSKTRSAPLARVKRDCAASLNGEMEELEKFLADRIGRLKAGLKEGEAIVADEAQHAEQLVNSLNESVAVLGAKLKAKEDAVRREELARQKIEENLNGKIHDLQSDVKKKEQALEIRSKEINDLKSSLDGQGKQVTELELAIEKANQETASHINHVEHLTKSSNAEIASLKGHLRETEEIVRRKESIIKGLEQALAAKIQDFENRIKDKEELLAVRDAEIDDLKSQLKLLTTGISQMSSFFRQAEALATIDGQDVSASVPNETLNGREKRTKATPNVSDPPREIVSPDLLNRITDELTEVMGVMRPIASVIVRDHVVALGETRETFPKARLPELLESLCKEILDENLKSDFRHRLAQSAQIFESGDDSIVTP